MPFKVKTQEGMLTWFMFVNAEYACIHVYNLYMYEYEICIICQIFLSSLRQKLKSIHLGRNGMNTYHRQIVDYTI